MSLRDQLLKAGLVTAEQVKAVETKGKKKNHEVNKNKALKKAEQQRKQQLQQQRQQQQAAKREQDKQLNQKRDAVKQRREELARIRQLLTTNRQNDPDAEQRYNFQAGNGIAQIAASSGFDVIMRDMSDDLVRQGMQSISTSLDRLVKKDKIGATDKATITARIRGVTAMEELSSADLVIEAVTENMDIKQEVFAGLNLICKPSAIIASNTSSLSLTKLATASGRAEKVVGVHFFNPVPVMQLVEIIRALQTSDETYQTVHEFIKRIGKNPVSVKDSPGFVVNRMLVPMINEAVFALYEGLASAEEIDAAMKLGANHPIGPLALADMIGLDVCLYVQEILLNEFGDSKYRPCPLLKQMVDAGFLGRKSGKGFFDYS